MDTTHLHLLLTHIPVMGVLFGFLLLAYSVIRKKDDVKKVAYAVFVLSALVTAPTFFTGEKSEEGVEDLPGVSERIMEQHEDTAKVAAGLTYLLGAIALIGLLLKGSDKTKNTVMASMLMLSLITTGVMAKTANLGGQIRHSEIRDGNASSAESEDKEKGEEGEKEEDEKGEKGEK